MWIMNLSVNQLEKSQTRQMAPDFEASLTPTQYPEKVKGILALYRKDQVREGYDVLVTGHTHKAGHTGDWYYNSGCWVGLRNNYLRIDSTGGVSVCEWKNGDEIVIEEGTEEQL